MLRWFCALAVAAVLSGLALLLVAGRYVEEGSTLVTRSAERGVHAGDVFVLGGWAVAILALLALAAMPPRRAGQGSPGS